MCLLPEKFAKDLKQARESLRITSKNAFPFFDISGKYNFINESNNMATLFNSDYYAWKCANEYGVNPGSTEAERYKHYLNKFLNDNSKLIETPIGQEIFESISPVSKERCIKVLPIGSSSS